MPVDIGGGRFATVGDLLDTMPVPADELVLVFDTETTGLPNFSAPSDHPDQPHIVSLAAELCRQDGAVVETYSEIVKVGVPIPAECTAIHGITDAIANERGLQPKVMLAEFFKLVDRAALVVGFNTGFDLRMVRIQSARHFGEKWDCPRPKDDVMWIVKQALGLPRRPKLVDAYQLVFGRPFEGAHTATADCQATREIFFEMRRRGYVAENPRAATGGNMPPADEPAAEAQPDTFASVSQEIEDLYAEARGWLDGEPITTEGQAADVAKLRDKIRDAEKRGEALRKGEAEPLDAAKKAVQDRYNPLVHKDKGKCALAISTCNNALAPWLRKLEDEQRAQAAAARAAADAAAAEALAAARAAADSTDIAQRERAEDMLGEAKSLLGGARRAEAAKPQVSGGTRAVGLKSVWKTTMTDPTAAIEHFRKARPTQLKEWMQQQAEAEVRSGVRDLPGFNITEERVPV